MSKKIQRSDPVKSLHNTRVISLIAFVFAVTGYWFAGYVNGNFSIDEYSEAFFQTVYLGSALLSSVAVGVMIYHSTRNISWKERFLVILLAVGCFVMASLALIGGLLVGAFTNF